MTTLLLEKVTALITRTGALGAELLLFRHTTAGIQIPAGGVEQDEAPVVAVLREASEETGLTGFTLAAYLGSAPDPWPADYGVVALTTPVFDQPDGMDRAWGQIRRGCRVRLNRRSGAYTQVTYEEWDQLAEPHFLSFVLTGWVRSAVLAPSPVRHFYHLTYEAPTPARWAVETERRIFEPFWAPLAALPPIVEPQRPWVQWLASRFPELNLQQGADA